jgi:hypothetical protein
LDETAQLDHDGLWSFHRSVPRGVQSCSLKRFPPRRGIAGRYFLR